MSGATAADPREPRHFDLGADRRARRLFGALVIAFALLAIGGGIFAAWLLLGDEPAPHVVAVPPKPPEPIVEHAPLEPWGEAAPAMVTERKTGPRLADGIGDGDLRRVLGRLQAAFDACAREHGAVEGTVVQLDFHVGDSGRVTESASRPPFASTPLGRCVAEVVRSKAVFPRTRNGRRDVRWSVRLRP